MKTREQKLKSAINYAVNHGHNENDFRRVMGDDRNIDNLIELVERYNDGKFSAKYFLSFVYA